MNRCDPSGRLCGLAERRVTLGAEARDRPTPSTAVVSILLKLIPQDVLASQGQRTGKRCLQPNEAIAAVRAELIDSQYTHEYIMPGDVPPFDRFCAPLSRHR